MFSDEEEDRWMNNSTNIIDVEDDDNLTEKIYKILIVVQWVLNLTSLVMALYFMNRTKKTSLIHPNLRTLLTWTVVVPFNIMMVARMADQLNESDWGVSIKSMEMTNYACLLFRFFHDASMPLEATAILLITVERLLAIVFRETYFMRGPVLSVALAAFAYFASWTFSLAFVGYDLLVKNVNIHVNYTCRTVVLHPTAVVIAWVVAAATCYLCALILFCIHKWNVYLMDRAALETADLQTRYQYRENVAIMRALIPAIAPYWILVLVGIGNAVYISLNFNLNDRLMDGALAAGATTTTIVAVAPTTTHLPRSVVKQVDVNFQMNYVIADLYGLIFKVVFICQYPPLRYRLLQDICSLFCAGSKHRNKIAPRVQLPRYETDPKMGSELYFNQLQNRWQPPHRSSN